MKEKYFRRCARFMQKGEMFCVNPRTHAGVITMDPWPKLVFLAADGEHTIEQIKSELEKRFQSDQQQVGADVVSLVEQLHRCGYLEIR